MCGLFSGFLDDPKPRKAMLFWSRKSKEKSSRFSRI